MKTSSPGSLEKTPSYPVVVRFYTADQLIAAVRGLEKNGWREWETFSPHPVEGIECRTNVDFISRTALIFGLFGLVAAFAMQVIPSSVLYPLLVGGKLTFSLPSSLPIALESTLLFAAIGSFTALLFTARLPCWHRSLFELEEFRKASRDAYFLTLSGKNAEEAAHFLLQVGGEPVMNIKT